MDSIICLLLNIISFAVYNVAEQLYEPVLGCTGVPNKVASEWIL